jgi:hypothetical protein
VHHRKAVVALAADGLDRRRVDAAADLGVGGDQVVQATDAKGTGTVGVGPDGKSSGPGIGGLLAFATRALW